MSGVVGKIEGVGNSIAAKGQSLVDSIFPPEKRAAFLAKIQSFALANPKLSAFFLTNLALTGFPLFLFILFTITVFVFSLIVALLLGVLAAVLFTVFAVGTALLVILPTTFFTTMAACFIFLWGLGGYYILRWANGGDTQAPEGKAIGDTLNNLTGGRLGGFMEGARTNAAKGDITGFSDKHTPAKIGDESNGKPAGGEKKAQTNGVQAGGDVAKHAHDAMKKADVGNATKAAQVNGVTNKAANAKGTVTGGVSGGTGLT